MPVDRACQLEPVAARTRLWLFVLCFALPVLITLVAVVAALLSEGPKRLILDSAAITLVASVLGVGALTAPIAWWLDRLVARHGIELTDGSITVATCVHRETLPLSDLHLDQARVFDLDEHPAYRPTISTHAFSLPGFQSGWFRLRNGEKALVACAGGRRLLRLPTSRGHCLLLQPRQPQVLLDRLQELAYSPGRR